MRTNNVVVLFLAIVMGGIAAFMARQWLQAHADMSAVASQGAGTIVVATQPLPFGATVSADNITGIPWGAGALPTTRKSHGGPPSSRTVRARARKTSSRSAVAWCSLHSSETSRC